jgi:large subunit ribosomal protein L29
MATSTEIAEFDIEELERQLNETRRELFNLRFQLATGQLDNPTRLKEVKKDIARMLTELRNREIAEAEGLALDQMPAHLAAARRRSEDEALGRERSTPSERRAAARAAEDEAVAGHAHDADEDDDLADVDEDEEIGRADDDGMGEAIGDAVPEDDDDEDGSK